jgi:hypothetical protein
MRLYLLRGVLFSSEEFISPQKSFILLRGVFFSTEELIWLKAV